MTLSIYVKIHVYKLNHIIYCYFLHILQAPNFVGVPLGLGQMILHCIYRHKRGPLVENAKVDTNEQLESITESIKVDIRNYTDKRKCCSDQDIEMQLKVWLKWRHTSLLLLCLICIFIIIYITFPTELIPILWGDWWYICLCK